MEEFLLQPEVRRLAKAIRFAFVSVILVLSYPTVRVCPHIGSFERIFRDMFPGRTLPAITQFIITTHVLFAVTSFLIPAAAIATLFTQRFVASFYVLGALVMMAMAQLILVYQALFIPLTQIVTTMQGG